MESAHNWFMPTWEQHCRCSVRPLSSLFHLELSDDFPGTMKKWRKSKQNLVPKRMACSNVTTCCRKRPCYRGQEEHWCWNPSFEFLHGYIPACKLWSCSCVCVCVPVCERCTALLWLGVALLWTDNAAFCLPVASGATFERPFPGVHAASFRTVNCSLQRVWKRDFLYGQIEH